VSETVHTDSTPLDPARLHGPVWVVAPHPDDEALGCAALLAALSDLGREVWALLMTDGGASHPGSLSHPRTRLAQLRLAEWRAGLAGLGVPEERTRALNLPDGALGQCDPAQVTAAVAAALSAAPPTTLLLPWRRDPHPDHRATWGPVRAALAPQVRRDAALGVSGGTGRRAQGGGHRRAPQPAGRDQ
jgi:LmbE family N-acetylglucosaminyl deacetylase